VASKQEANAPIIEEFRANGGKVGGHFEGRPLLLLTSTGAKTGQARTAPVMYLADGDRYVVFASNSGSEHHPAWYTNLRANRDVTIEVGTETHAATATVLEGEERDELFRQQAERYPFFAEYEAGTERVIPVVALTPKQR
jgi:deazaflavin-dependent oxidoreductase (nitroreductase family)